MKKNFKQKHLTRLLFIFVFFNFLFFGVPKASAWETWLSIPMGVMMDKMYDNMQGVILGAAKKAALMALEQEISYAITGSSANGVKFIADWRAYMVDDPQKKSNIYINDYISQAVMGRGSHSGYEGVGGGPAFTVNYNGQLAEGARNATSGSNEPRVTYEGNPSQMFASGNFRNMNSYLSGINNPWAFNMHIQDKYQTNLKNEKDIAMTMAISYQGFTGTLDTSSGMITGPGILAKELLTKVNNLPMDIIAAAKNIPEILTSIATQIITQSITQGIGNIQASIHSEISDVRGKMSNNQRELLKIAGPEVLYKKR